MLNKSVAAVAVLTGCSSVDCIGKVTGSTTVVGVASDKDGVTSSNYGAQALGAFVNVLVGTSVGADTASKPGNVGQAIDAANPIFEKAGIDDCFELIRGSRERKLE
jgi:hypothetical protein